MNKLRFQVYTTNIIDLFKFAIITILFFYFINTFIFYNKVIYILKQFTQKNSFPNQA